MARGPPDWSAFETSGGTAPGMLVWMPSNSGGACTPIRSTTSAPQSPPCATNCVVSKALHQHDPGTGDAGGIPAGRGRLARKPVARHRRNHEMERVRCARAMCRGIGEGIDDLQLLDDRAGPPVRDDERQRVLVLRTNVNEMNVQPIDLGDELRQGVQSRLALAPVVVCRPVARELLDRRQLHALRLIADGFLVRPSRGLDPAAQVGERLFGDTRRGTDESPFLSAAFSLPSSCNTRLAHGE